MKVLMISLQPNTDTIGLKYVHSYLCGHGVDSYILFIPQFDNKSASAVNEFLHQLRPEVVGIGLMSDSYYQASALSADIKKEFPQVVVVWGGIHPSVAPGECLEYADYVFIGEAEESFLEFMNALQSGQSVNCTPNLAYRLNGNLIVNKPGPLREDLDSLPFPEHFPQKSYVLHGNKVMKMDTHLFRRYSRFSGRVYSLMTTRGCPYHCTYCCNSFFVRLYGSKFLRERSARNVIDELKHELESFPDLIYIGIEDDSFFLHDIEWVREFSHLYAKEIGRKIVCTSAATNISEEKVRLLKEAGLSWLLIGIQSGSPRINKYIYKRPISNEAIIRATELTKKYNIAGLYDVILDNPFETEEDLIETINLILKIKKPYQFQIYSLTFYQGTELYNMAMNEELQIDDPRAKIYFKFRRSPLNKIVRLCPLLPKPFIRFLVENRNSLAGMVLLKAIYVPSLVFIEPLVWFRLILISFDNNFFKAVVMVAASLKTGASKFILRRYA